MITNFDRNKTGWKLDALLDQPGDVPEITVLDAVLTEGERDDLVRQDFLPALRLKNEARGAEIEAVQSLIEVPERL